MRDLTLDRKLYRGRKGHFIKFGFKLWWTFYFVSLALSPLISVGIAVLLAKRYPNPIGIEIEQGALVYFFSGLAPVVGAIPSIYLALMTRRHWIIKFFMSFLSLAFTYYALYLIVKNMP